MRNFFIRLKSCRNILEIEAICYMKKKFTVLALNNRKYLRFLIFQGSYKIFNSSPRSSSSKKTTLYECVNVYKNIYVYCNRLYLFVEILRASTLVNVNVTN